MAIARGVGIGKTGLLGQAPTLEPNQTFSLTQTGNIR